MSCKFYSYIPNPQSGGRRRCGMSPFYDPYRATIIASLEKAAFAEAQKQSEKFEVRVKSEGFKPEDLDVSVADGHLIVNGKHGEREENGSFVTRSFTRRFPLPKNVNLEAMNCKFDAKGQLTISAPFIVEEEKPNVINIPIQIVKNEMKEAEKSNSYHGELEFES